MGGIEIQYFTSGAESQILNVALPEEEEDSVTCDAIVANILADASFTAELRDHGFSHLGCGVIVAPIVIPQARKPKCCGRHDMRELVQNAGDPLNRLVRLNAGETKNGDGRVIPLGDELL